jgi:hypothetical protein
MGHQKSAEAIVGGETRRAEHEVPRVGGGDTRESMKAEANRSDEAYVSGAGRNPARFT